MAATGLSAESQFRAPDSSPESVVFTLDSNFSVFSSTSASVERCSFASDAHDYDCRTSDISRHLEANDDEFKERTSPDSKENQSIVGLGEKHCRLPGKGEKMKAVEIEDSYGDAMNEHQPLDIARNSFSLALIECRDRRTRTEALLNRVDRQRHASLDMNNVTESSPRLTIMKKNTSSQMSGINIVQSPAAKSCRPVNADIQKGWCSERVPLHNNGSMKHVSPAVFPFNNGKILPSKWEDAERWIFSPGSRDGTFRHSVPPPQRRPKSKSGPLGFHGNAYNSLYSPAMLTRDGSKVVNFTASPFSEAVIAADELGIQSSANEAESSKQTQPCIARSVSLHGCTQMDREPSLTASVGQIFDGIKDTTTNMSHDVSRRDVATQMSPDDRSQSSLEIRPPISLSTPAQPIGEWKSPPCSKLEVKDVVVDGRVTLTRWSKKHKSRMPSKGQVHDKDAESAASAWDVSDSMKSISKVMREEAKITAWENLQKAKAEASIKKLEMKLERKRSSSIDKITLKLNLAQQRAQEMRNSMLADHVSTSHKATSGRTSQKISLSSCFTCEPF